MVNYKKKKGNCYILKGNVMAINITYVYVRMITGSKLAWWLIIFIGEGGGSYFDIKRKIIPNGFSIWLFVEV